MKFFCLSDTHGGQPPAALMYASGQVVLHAGDFYNEGSPEAHSGWAKVIADNDILMVRGNHDCVDTELLKAHDLTMGLCRVGDLWVVGIGWCGQEYNQLPPESLMTKMIIRLLEAVTKTFSEGNRSIVVTHYPPTHPSLRNQEGWEFKCIQGLVDALRPVAVIAGHRHGKAGKVLYQGDVPVIFPGPLGGWLDVTEEGAKWNP